MMEDDPFCSVSMTSEELEEVEAMTVKTEDMDWDSLFCRSSSSPKMPGEIETVTDDKSVRDMNDPLLLPPINTEQMETPTDDILNKTETTYPCTVCSKIFYSNYVLQKHLQIHNDGNLYGCDVCYKSMRTKRSLALHMMTHTGEQKYKCHLCTSAFPEQSELEKHMEKTHVNKQKRFTCTFCAEMFDDADECQRHVESHDGDELYSCEVCGKSYTKSFNLSKHMLVHTRKIKHKCKICNSKFATQASLKSHVTMAHGAKHFTCLICEKSFYKKSTAMTHLQLVHKTEDSFQIADHSDHHPKVHEFQKPARTYMRCVESCEICSFKSRSKSLLQKHMLTHTKPFTGLVGDESFALKQSAVQHLKRNHNLQDSSEFSIRRDGLTAIDPEDVKSEQTYKCNFCVLVFEDIENLETHLLSHREEPENFTACSETFIEIPELQTVNFEEKEKSGETYGCEFCELTFDDAENLQTHLPSHYEESEDILSNVYLGAFEENHELLVADPIEDGKCEETHESNFCELKFEGEDNLNPHLRSHNKQRYKCSECGITLSTKDSLRQHTATHERFKCKICHSKFQEHSDLIAHISTHSNEEQIEKTYSCKLCKLAFEDEQKFQTHLLTHGNRSYKCSVCESVFSTYCALKFHMKTHEGLQCKICQKYFQEHSDLQAHLLTHSKGNAIKKVYKCKHCELSFEDEKTLKTHLLSHRDQPYKCSECGKCLSSNSCLNRHMKSHFPTFDQYKCRLCEVCFENEKDLKSHFLSHRAQQYKCVECGKYLSSSSCLNRHMKIHLELPKQYKCRLCELSFEDENNLKTHLLSHRQPYQCSECGKSYINSSCLNRHMRDHHELPSVKQYNCSFCELSFEDENNLKTHLLIHRDLPYKCSECGMSYNRDTSLARHIEDHHKLPSVKQYKCSFCEMCFKDQKGLKSHLNTHGDRYKCLECGICLSGRNILRGHMEIHERLNCKICQMKFREHSDLVAHILTHSPIDEPKIIETIYKCRFCESTFKKENRLEIHVEKIHGDRPFKCPECKKGFANEGALIEHQVIATGTGGIKFVCEICQANFTRSSCMSYHMLSHFK